MTVIKDAQAEPQRQTGKSVVASGTSGSSTSVDSTNSIVTAQLVQYPNSLQPYIPATTSFSFFP